MTLSERIREELDRRLKIAEATQAVRPGPWRAVATHEGGALDGGQRIFSDQPGGKPGRILIKMVVDIPLHPVDRGDGVFMVPIDLAAYFVTEHPEAALRRYAAARRVLERHTQHLEELDLDLLCAGCHYREHWPCPDIRDLADSLGIEVSP